MENVTWTLSELIAELGPIGAYIVAYGTITAYVCFGVALFLAVLFPTIQMVRDIKTALKTLVSVAFIIVIFFVCYSMAVAEPYSTGTGDDLVTVAAGTMKLVEACLYMTYLMFGAAILFVFIAPLAQFIKK